MNFLASDSVDVSEYGLGQESSAVHPLPNVPKDLVKVSPMFQDVSVDMGNSDRVGLCGFSFRWCKPIIDLVMVTARWLDGTNRIYFSHTILTIQPQYALNRE